MLWFFGAVAVLLSSVNILSALGMASGDSPRAGMFAMLAGFGVFAAAALSRVGWVDLPKDHPRVRAARVRIGLPPDSKRREKPRDDEAAPGPARPSQVLLDAASALGLDALPASLEDLDGAWRRRMLGVHPDVAAGSARASSHQDSVVANTARDLLKRRLFP